MPTTPLTAAASAVALAGVLAGLGGSAGLGAPAGLGGAAAHAVTPSTTAAGPGASAAAGAAHFIVGQLVAGDHVLDYPGTDQADLGLTMDAVLGLLATGSGASAARAATEAIAGSLDDYLGPSFGAQELYAGPVAKATLLAVSMDQNPRTFGGHDLVADLSALEAADGRFADRTAYGDTSNTFTQALGLIAQARAGTAPSGKAVNFLLAQACPDGGYRMFPGPGACVGDPDAAALAVVALAATGGHDAALDRAVDFLAERQQAGGGLAGGSGAGSVNSNTTGLAGMAFAVADRGAHWAAATDFLTSLQLGCDAPPALRGALAYDAPSHAALVAAGDAAVATDQERRATVQAMLSLGTSSLIDTTITTAAEPVSPCEDPDPSSSSSTTSGTSTASAPTTTSTAPTTPTPSTTPAPTATTTAATSRTPAATTAASVTQPVAPGTPRSTPAAPSATTTATGAATDTTPAPGPTSSDTSGLVAAAGANSPGGQTNSGGTAALVAGALVLLGAAGAVLILRRGRPTS